MGSTPRIASVSVIEALKLGVLFTNGEYREYDCLPLTRLPAFRMLLVPAFFKNVRVDPGGYGVSWNDDIDVSEDELWTRGMRGATLNPAPTSPSAAR